ncbi:MAG TPA: hypothetical protein VGK21_13860 [Candidatus Angelobacter sp.]|jgi:hypothetical protein
MLGFTEDRQMYVTVRIDLMRRALESFYAVVQQHSHKRGWSHKAENAVYAAVRADWRNQLSYLKRCHAFRNMVSKGALTKTLHRYVQQNGTIDDRVMDTVAVTPLHRDGKFRIKEFAAAVEKSRAGS